LSPNPTTGLLNVNLKMTQAADVQIEVVNTLGQTVETLQLGKTTGVNQSIDLSGVASGMYTIRVRMDNETAVRRVAVQH
jgi:stage V sporulation protein SpoVS